MPQPYPIQGVGDAIAGPAQRVEGNADQVLEPIARPIQPLLTPNEGQQPRRPLLEPALRRLFNHGISPSSRAKTYGQNARGISQ